MYVTFFLFVIIIEISLQLPKAQKGKLVLHMGCIPTYKVYALYFQF